MFSVKSLYKYIKSVWFGMGISGRDYKSGVGLYLLFWEF